MIYQVPLLTAAECEEVTGLFPESRAARIIKLSGEVRGATIRRGKVAFLDEANRSHPIVEKIRAAVQEVNAKIFKFDLAGAEAMQCAEYNVGDGYGWHLDLGPGGAARRKLSATVQLSAPEDYDGGELLFFGAPGPAERAQGSIAIFPAYLLHRVVPVTRGLRKAIVVWESGEVPFR